jgi:hypothetical protein
MAQSLVDESGSAEPVSELAPVLVLSDVGAGEMAPTHSTSLPAEDFAITKSSLETLDSQPEAPAPLP